jgi:hypothetical protein
MKGAYAPVLQFDTPEAVCRRASESYMEPVLRAAGAVRPRLIWDSPVPDGERLGMPLVRIPSKTCWG